MIGSIKFDPSAVRTITIDWTRFPFPGGCGIASAVWTVPVAFEVIDQSVVGKKTNVRVRFRYPTSAAKQLYEFSCLMTTNEQVTGPNLPTRDTRRIGVEVLPR